MATILAAHTAVAGYAVVLKVSTTPYTAQHSAYPRLVGHYLFWEFLGAATQNTPLAVTPTWAWVFYRIPVVV